MMAEGDKERGTLNERGGRRDGEQEAWKRDELKGEGWEEWPLDVVSVKYWFHHTTGGEDGDGVGLAVVAVAALKHITFTKWKSNIKNDRPYKCAEWARVTEGGRCGRLVSYYLSGRIRNNQGRVKGKVIVIKRRGPASGRPRCGRAYKRTGSRQFNSGSSPRQASHATKEEKEVVVEGGQRIWGGWGFLLLIRWKLLW